MYEVERRVIEGKFESRVVACVRCVYLGSMFDPRAM